MYSDVSKNGRASSYQSTIEWLRNAGLIHSAYNISSPKLPLSGYADRAKFKVYLLDTGLLGAMLKVAPSIMLEPNEIFSEFNGAITENFVATQLIIANGNELFYWTSRSDAEVDFVIERGSNTFPIEVKSGFSKAKKSLQSYNEKFHPPVLFRLSPRNFIKQDNFINIPLYAVNFFSKFEHNSFQ